MNIGKYIGLPYSLRPMPGCVNCWGLVALVYSQEKSEEIPIFKSNSTAGIAAAFTAAFAADDHGFYKVELPQDYDVIIFINDSVNRSEYHCGIYYNGKVLHAGRALGGSVYQDIDVAKETFNRVEFWRL